FIPNEVDDSLEDIRYVVINGKNYLALDETPEEFTKQGVNIDRDYFKDFDISNLLPSGLAEMDGVATKHAKENGKRPETVSGVTLKGKSLTWSKHNESDIVGYRIYSATEDSDQFDLVTSVATFSDSTSFTVPSQAHKYAVTAVDVAGNESPS